MKEPSVLPIALYLCIFVWLPLVVPRRRLRDRKGKLHQRSEELARHNTGCSEDPATLYETDSVFAVAAEVGSLNADERLSTGLGRFSGVSPPGGGTRVDNLRKAWEDIYNARTLHPPLGSHNGTPDNLFVIIGVDIHRVFHGADRWNVSWFPLYRYWYWYRCRRGRRWRSLTRRVRLRFRNTLELHELIIKSTELTKPEKTPDLALYLR
jgi:hypothetical protein